MARDKRDGTRNTQGAYVKSIFKGPDGIGLGCDDMKVQLFPCCRDLKFQDAGRVASYAVLPNPNSSCERRMSSVRRKAH